MPVKFVVNSREHCRATESSATLQCFHLCTFYLLTS